MKSIKLQAESAVGRTDLNSKNRIALLSQEGSGIVKRIPRGVVPKPIRFVMGTTPRTISTSSRSCCPPDSGGQFALALYPTRRAEDRYLSSSRKLFRRFSRENFDALNVCD
jgi:hypothetical protein